MMDIKEAVKTLIDAGYDIVNDRFDFHRNFFLEVIKKNDIKTLEDIIEFSKNIDIQDCLCNTPMELAINQDHYYMVKFLIEKGSDINAKNDYGETPLHNAIWKSNFEIIKYLVEKGADINAKDNYGDTPLNYAIWHSNFEIVKYLVEHGADVNHRNINGKTPLILSRSISIKKYLIENWAK